MQCVWTPRTPTKRLTLRVAPRTLPAVAARLERDELFGFSVLVGGAAVDPRTWSADLDATPGAGYAQEGIDTPPPGRTTSGAASGESMGETFGGTGSDR